jgi:D-aminoacyl-tRNA deacylase
MESENTAPIIVASEKDPASLNIAENLIAKHGFAKTHGASGVTYESKNISLVIVDKLGIDIGPEDIPSKVSSIIFASKHVSATGRPALTIHATGNLNKSAKFGGRPEEVSFVDTAMIKQGLKALAESVSSQNLKIETVMEGTHHGPTSFPVPVCFIEIGSGEQQWTDPLLGKIVADSIMKTIGLRSKNGVNVVGFGGTHYSEKHTRLNLEDQYSIGHLVPKHALEAGVSDTVLRDTFAKTCGGCSSAIIDWKGIKGNDRRSLLETLGSWDIEIIRI